MPVIDTSRVTRFEVIDHRLGHERGRRFVAYRCAVSLSLQDGDRTLKVFVDDPPNVTRPREITAGGARYRVVGGVVQCDIGHGWCSSSHTAAIVCALADLLNNPTETVEDDES